MRQSIDHIKKELKNIVFDISFIETTKSDVYFDLEKCNKLPALLFFADMSNESEEILHKRKTRVKNQTLSVAFIDRVNYDQSIKHVNKTKESLKETLTSLLSTLNDTEHSTLTNINYSDYYEMRELNMVGVAAQVQVKHFGLNCKC